MPDSGKKNHTTRLTDGDFIMSPSLTNLFEGTHGNGIILLEDGATSTSGNRNTPASLSGAVAKNGTNGLTIKAGYAVIDGMVVDFGDYTVGTNANDYTITLDSSRIEGTNTALSANESVLLVVYVSTYSQSNYKHIMVEMGTAVSSGFPVTPESFLSDPSILSVSGDTHGVISLNSKQSTVLAVVKCVHNASGGDLELEVDTVYDMRTFIRHSPIYMAPMTKDTIGTFTNRITSAADLDGMHGGGDETGALTNSDNPLGALWMSNNTDSESILYFSAVQDNTSGTRERNTWRLGPDNLKVVNTTQTPKVDGANYLIMTPAASGVEVNPSGSFPKSHTITILNLSSSHTIAFDASGVNLSVGTNESAIFAYDGAVWRRAFVSGNVSGAASGAVGRVQLSNGSGDHTSDADLIFAQGEVTGVLVNNGSGYSSGHTGAVVVDTVDATTKISVGDVLRRTNNAGAVIGTVTAVTSTSITFAAGTLTALSNNDPLYREGRLTIDGVTDISKPIFGPTGVEFTPIAKNPYKGTAANTLWRNSSDSNRLYIGGEKIALSSDPTNTTFIGLTDVDEPDFTGHGGEFLKVNSTPDGVEFGTIASGDLPSNLNTITAIGHAGTLTVNQDLTVSGNLTVSGTTTTLDVATVNVEDINMTLGNASPVGNDAAVDGGGITLASSDGNKTILFADSTDSWTFNQHLFPDTDSSKNLGSSTIRWATSFSDAVNTGTITGSGDVTIATSVFKVDSTGKVGVNQASPAASFQYESVGHGYVTGSSGSGSDAAVAHTLFAKTAFRGAKLLVAIHNTDDSEYETHEAVITHDGTTGASAAMITTYGTVKSASQTVCTLGAQESGGNIQLTITPGVSSRAYTFKVAWKGIAI